MKKLAISFLFMASILVADKYAPVLESNQKLKKINIQIENKTELLRKEIADFKVSQIEKIKNDMKKEQADYESVVKSFNFFKLKHEKNIYAQKKIKANEKKLKEISKNHLDFKQRHSVKIEQLSHSDFVPEEKKATQEKIFFFEIKSEEFKEMFKVNKERYENSINLAIERFKSDSDTLVEEFSDLKYSKLK